MSRKRRSLVALAIVALIGAGCSNGSSETGTVASSATATAASTGGNKTTAKREKGVKFAECMRENGVSDFPDPNAKGEFVYGVSVSPAVWTKAVSACKDLQPAGTLSAERSPEQQSDALEFAQCVRENGVKDFPDPVKGEPLIDTTKIPSSNQPGGMTILNAATKKCGDLLGKAAAGR